MANVFASDAQWYRYQYWYQP